jgi:hypothetical protein
VKSRRLWLQLRLVQAVMRHARPAERQQMLPRAIAILDQVALEIVTQPDPEAAELLARLRAETDLLRQQTDRASTLTESSD